MFELVELAIDRENYHEAKEILSQLSAEEKNDLWIRYYQTLILEKQGNLTESEESYRQIVKDCIYPDAKLLKLIRDALERILKINQKKQENQQQIRLRKLQEFQESEHSKDLAVLVLKPVNLEQKKLLAPKFAQVMNLDNYTANLQIPTRSLRLYKTGNFGTLNYYQTELSQAGIPCFCQRINNINKMKVYQVKYLLTDNGEVNILCEDDQEKEINLSFQWREINHKILALIPIFENTVHIDAKGKLLKKKSTLDYIKFYDLHLVSQNLILRFNDQFYQFDRAVPFHNQGLPVSKQGKTVQEKWQYLIDFLEQKIPDKPLWSDFTLFAEGAIEFPEMLKQITPYINLFRKEKTLWDQAFQLYSGLIFFID